MLGHEKSMPFLKIKRKNTTCITNKITPAEVDWSPLGVSLFGNKSQAGVISLS